MANCRWWFISNRSAGGTMGISFQPATEQFSESHSGEGDCRRYTPRADVRCLLRTGCGANSISSLSSDALLMNIFCYPGVTRRIEVCGILGIEAGSLPEFAFMPRVPLFSEATERTEIDMTLGHTLFEAT